MSVKTGSRPSKSVKCPAQRGRALVSPSLGDLVGLLHRHLEGGLDVVLHCPPPAVEGPSAELVHQVFSDRSPGDGSQNGFSGLSASADMTGEQDGVGEDLLSQHVDHRGCRPRPVTTGALRRCDLLDVDPFLFLLPVLGRPSLAVATARVRSVRGSQGQPGGNQGLGARGLGAEICRSRGPGFLGPQADLLRRGWGTGGNREAPHDT
nr:hypothetical protein Iba_chr02cCG3390 [Ipomoea batatas]